MKVLGVDLGSYSIKIAELEKKSKGYVFSNFFEFPLSPDPNRDRSLDIIETLRNFSVNYDPNHTHWVIGISQSQLSVHFKKFPFKERTKILKSLPFELEDDIPLDIDDTVFDFKLVQSIGSVAEVLTVACPKESVEEILNIAKDGGFDPDIVSAEGLAFANVFERWDAPPPELPPKEGEETEPPTSASGHAILHIGHSHSLLLIYREGVLIATRSILWGGRDIADNISRDLGISIFEAIKTLNSKGFILMNSAGASRDQLKLSQAIAAQVDFLIKELKLILLEVKSEFQVDYREIQLSGGASRIQNLGAYLTQGLEIPANANLTPLADKPTRFEVTPHIEAVAAPALGLAIEGIKRPRNPAINLRRGEFERENVALKRFWEQWRVTVHVAVAAFVVFFVYSIIRDQLAAGLVDAADEQLKEAATKAANLRGGQVTEIGIQRYIRTQKDRLKNQDALSQLEDYISAADVLAKLSEKMPKNQPNQGYDVVFLEIENEDLTIRGRAQSLAQVVLIEKALEEIALPGSIAKIGTGDVKGGTPFGFKMKVRRRD